MKEKIKIANDILSKQLSWISAADSKVPSIFAINVVMLSVLAALIPPLANWTIFGAVITTLPTILLIGSMVSLTLVTFPRLVGPKGSLIYFGGITTKSEDSYVNEMTNIEESIFLKDILTQTYKNAEIAKSKYLYVKCAMGQTFISLPIWLIAVWFLYRLK